MDLCTIEGLCCEEMGDGCFYNCTLLQSMKGWPTSMTVIPGGTFLNCTGMSGRRAEDAASAAARSANRGALEAPAPARAPRSPAGGRAGACGEAVRAPGGKGRGGRGKGGGSVIAALHPSRCLFQPNLLSFTPKTESPPA
jgi:hypothetical protein